MRIRRWRRKKGRIGKVGETIFHERRTKKVEKKGGFWIERRKTVKRK